MSRVSDKELLDYLQLCLDSGHIYFEKTRKTGLESYDNQFNEKNIYQIFTVPSQHIRGSSIRDVIENAILKTRREK